MSEATLRVTRVEGPEFDIPVIVRIDTPIEIDYYRAGGILPYTFSLKFCGRIPWRRKGFLRIVKPTQTGMDSAKEPCLSRFQSRRQKDQPIIQNIRL